MPLQKVQVGNDLYVFTKKPGAKGPGDKAVIVANSTFYHSNAQTAKRPMGERWGGYSPVLAFYSPHGMKLEARAELSVAMAYEPYEFVPAESAPDYRLFKGVNGNTRKKHNTEGLQYATLEDIDQLLSEMSKTSQASESIYWIGSFSRAALDTPDIISIRNRWPHWPTKGVLLSEVITALNRANYKYGQIHCKFSRAGASDALYVPSVPEQFPADLKFGKYQK